MSLQNNTNELNIIGSHIAHMKEEYGTQSGLIAQIKTVLEQKASGEVPPSKLASYFNGSLTEITEQDLQGITQLRNNIFYYAPITSVDIPNSVASIGESAFYGCSSLMKATIPNSVISIGSYVFYKCSALMKVTIPSSVKTIGNNAFNGCSSLTEVTIPDSVTSIGASGFAYCGLTSVTIGNNVKKLDNSLFINCTSLTSITIPATVTRIEVAALKIGSTEAKATIEFKGTTPPTITSSTFDTTKLEKIIVPKGYGDTYKSKTNWSNFADYIVESET